MYLSIHGELNYLYMYQVLFSSLTTYRANEDDDGEDEESPTDKKLRKDALMDLGFVIEVNEEGLFKKYCESLLQMPLFTRDVCSKTRGASIRIWIGILFG